MIHIIQRNDKYKKYWNITFVHFTSHFYFKWHWYKMFAWSITILKQTSEPQTCVPMAKPNTKLGARLILLYQQNRVSRWLGHPALLTICSWWWKEKKGWISSFSELFFFPLRRYMMESHPQEGLIIKWCFQRNWWNPLSTHGTFRKSMLYWTESNVSELRFCFKSVFLLLIGDLGIINPLTVMK